MPQRQYDKATAQAIMQLAYPEYEGLPSAPYIENDDGMYVNESFRTASPPGTAFDWTPADEMDWPGSPNPNTAPFLPIPFTASELAACMLDGPGQSIQFALDRCIGYPLDDEALGSFHARHRWMRDTLEEAYALAAAAQLIVGEFDYDEKARAHTLALQYDDADGQANAREGVFEHGITTEEARARRARAVASVADLKAQAKQAQAAVADKWKAWRKAMVFQLLGTGAQQSHVAAQSPATPAPSPAEPPQAVPAEPCANDDEDWKGKARQMASEIIKRQCAKDLYPSQEDIADEIARRFRADRVMGAGGKPLTGAYIKRHAIKGISSAKGRQLSTSIRRGK